MGCMAASSVSSIPWPHSHPSASWRILKSLYLPILAHSSSQASQTLACPGCPQSTIVRWWITRRMDSKECWGKMERWTGVLFWVCLKCCRRCKKHQIKPKVALFVTTEFFAVCGMNFESLLLLWCGCCLNCNFDFTSAQYFNIKGEHFLSYYFCAIFN